jgi:hypothetical protein
MKGQLSLLDYLIVTTCYVNPVIQGHLSRSDHLSVTSHERF